MKRAVLVLMMLLPFVVVASRSRTLSFVENQPSAAGSGREQGVCWQP